MRRIRAIGAVIVLGLALTGCLEQLSTTRIPGGSVRNFFYFMSHNQPTEAESYWAPDHAPADAAGQVQTAITRLKGWDVEATKAETTPEPDGSQTVILSGHAGPACRSAPGCPPISVEVIPLMRAHVIAIGPGWRVTDFTLLCCDAK
jgi:hypothetical protein